MLRSRVDAHFGLRHRMGSSGEQLSCGLLKQAAGGIIGGRRGNRGRKETSNKNKGLVALVPRIVYLLCEASQELVPAVGR